MRQQGQAALITLLVLTIAATVGLSLIARTTTDVGRARTTEESSRAFSAAEAGIELALKSSESSGAIVNEVTGDRYDVTVTPVIVTANTPYTLPNKTLSGDTETIWLVAHAADGSLVETPTYTAASIDVCWSAEAVVPALAVTVIYKESSDATGNPYRVVKGAYDPTPRSGNSFSVPTATTGGCGGASGTTYRQTIQFSTLAASIDPTVDTLLFIRLRPIYSDTTLAVTPLQTLPVQGNRVESVGKTTSGVARKIVVFRPYIAPASIFDAAIYSEGSLTTQ